MAWVNEDETVWKTADIEEILTRQKDIELNRIDTVVIVGVGGIGYWVAKFLALSRQVKKMILIDPEYVEPVNLNRIDFNEFTIGTPKVEATRLNIEFTVAKHPKIVAIHDKYDPKYIPKGAGTVVVECVDHVETSNRVVKEAREMGLPVISVHYDGVAHITISVNEAHGEWGEGGGYVRTPSFVVPAAIAGALAVWIMLTSNIWEIQHTWYFSISEWFM